MAQALRLIDDPDVLLVAVGGGNSRVFADAKLADPRVRHAGYVTDGELRARQFSWAKAAAQFDGILRANCA